MFITGFNFFENFPLLLYNNFGGIINQGEGHRILGQVPREGQDISLSLYLVQGAVILFLFLN